MWTVDAVCERKIHDVMRQYDNDCVCKVCLSEGQVRYTEDLQVCVCACARVSGPLHNIWRRPKENLRIRLQKRDGREVGGWG